MLGLPADFGQDPRHATVSLRRRALLLGYLNSMLWSVGNGLTTGPLVIYLIRDLGARGRDVGLILAIPALVGVLRILTPGVICWFGTAKRACLALSLASYALIWMLPAAGIRQLVPRGGALPLLVTILCVHQLLEFMALAARWGWMADLVPRRIRGRYFGRTQILQLAVLIPALLASGYFTDSWRASAANRNPDRLLIGYVIPNAVGAAMLLGSLVPLGMMPASIGRRHPITAAVSSQPFPLSSVIAPWRDARFWPLLIFGCWLSFSNGITQAAQNIYPKDVLLLGLFALAVMRTVMQIGQMGYSAWAGPFSDQFGNRPALITSQFLLAGAPLFFIIASPEHPYLVTGAWIAWSAYAGLNICLPNLSLKLGGTENAASYVATYFGMTSVFYAGSTIAGGYLFDQLGQSSMSAPVGQFGGRFAAFFWVAFVLRATAVLWLLMIPEPGAWTWRRILRRRLIEETRIARQGATPLRPEDD